MKLSSFLKVPHGIESLRHTDYGKLCTKRKQLSAKALWGVSPERIKTYLPTLRHTADKVLGGKPQ
jgi:hypothetical protein